MLQPSGREFDNVACVRGPGELPKSQDNPSTRLVARTWCFFPLNSKRPARSCKVHAENPKRGTERRERFTSPLPALLRETKIRFLIYMLHDKPSNDLPRWSPSRTFPWILILGKTFTTLHPREQSLTTFYTKLHTRENLSNKASSHSFNHDLYWMTLRFVIFLLHFIYDKF